MRMNAPKPAAQSRKGPCLRGGLGPMIARLGLVLAEVKLLRAVFPEGIAREPAPAFGAKVVPEILRGWCAEFGVGQPLFHVLQQLADRFHVVLVKVRFGEFRGIVGGEYFDFDHIAVVVSRPKLLAAEITRDV
jgi:hypothetical protein